jgi:hypothetical protein
MGYLVAGHHDTPVSVPAKGHGGYSVQPSGVRHGLYTHSNLAGIGLSDGISIKK